MKHIHIRSIMILAILTLLVPLLAKADLDADFTALAKYEFGSDRTALTNIEKAVNSAAVTKDSAVMADLEKRLCAVLEANSTVEAKRFVCRQLHEFGTDSCVSTLAGLLKDADTCQAALTALETNRTTAATDALIAATKSLKDRQKIAAVASLGCQGGEKAVATLKALLSDADPAVAAQAAEALASKGLKSSCEELVEALKSAPADKKSLYTTPCVECAAEQANTQWLTMLNGADFPAHVRVAALGGLMKTDPANAPTLLVAALNDPDQRISRPALGLARKTEGKEITDVLSKAVEIAAPDQQAALLNVLAARGDKSALPAALKLADSDNLSVAAAALHAIGALGSETEAKFLVGKAASTKGDLKTTAQDALNVLRGDNTDKTLLTLAKKDQSPEQRVQAIRSLGERRAFESAGDLLALAKDKDADVRSESLKALRILGKDSDIIPLIVLLLSAEDNNQRDNVTRAIVAIAERNPNADKRAETVIEAMEKNRKTENQIALIGVLAGIGTVPAFDTLNTRFEKADPPVRLAIIDAYTSWPNGGPLDAMLAILKTPKDDTERGKAFAGYLRLLRYAANTESSANVCARYGEVAQMAKDKSEKRAVLAGLADVAAPEALTLVDELAKDPELAAEALRASVRIAENVCGADPDGVKARLTKILETKPDQGIKQTIGKIMGQMDRFSDYIAAWEVAGPYFEEGKGMTQIFDVPFAPEKGDENVGWRVMPMGLDDARGWLVMLDKVLGGEERVAYLRTRIFSPDAREAMLELGTNDGCKVWLNGELIHKIAEGRALSPGQDKIKIKLNPGCNTLMVAVYQMGGAWSACARLTDPEGHRAQKLRYSVRTQ